MKKFLCVLVTFAIATSFAFAADRAVEWDSGAKAHEWLGSWGGVKANVEKKFYGEAEYIAGAYKYVIVEFAANLPEAGNNTILVISDGWGKEVYKKNISANQRLFYTDISSIKRSDFRADLFIGVASWNLASFDVKISFTDDESKIAGHTKF